MNDQERQRYHDMANKIARDALPGIKGRQALADEIQPQPRLTPIGAVLYLSEAEREEKASLLADARELEEAAKVEIEKWVISYLPPEATDRDRQLIKDQAYDILRIPPEQREWNRTQDNPQRSHSAPEEAENRQNDPEMSEGQGREMDEDREAEDDRERDDDLDLDYG